MKILVATNNIHTPQYSIYFQQNIIYILVFIFICTMNTSKVLRNIITGMTRRDHRKT